MKNRLSVAINTETSCLSHSALTSDTTVYTQVQDFANG
jgi:hypothetical protein